MLYDPQPIDTSSVTLNPEIYQLTERLAEHAHDLWAGRRLAEGWTYGPQRDDAAKRHPCLVPYDQLPNSEKQYDRAVAMGTLKAILALGYQIEKKARRPPPGGAPSSSRTWVLPGGNATLRSTSASRAEAAPVVAADLVPIDDRHGPGRP